MKQHNAVEVLARLLHENDLRRRFGADRKAVIRELEISEDQAEVLLGLDGNELESQATALVRKRASEVAGLVPQTWRRLGVEADVVFQRYVHASDWPTGHRKHLLDAVRFCDFLSRSGQASDARSEQQWVRFLTGRSLLSIGFDHRMIIRNRQRMGLLLFFRWRGSPFRYRAHLPAFSFGLFT